MKSLGLRERPKREIQGVERKDDNVEECGAGELQGVGWMLLCQPQHFYFHENVKILRDRSSISSLLQGNAFETSC